MSLKTKLLGWTSGVNWQLFLIKWGAVALVFASAIALAYDRGKSNCEVAHANAAQEKAEAQIVYFVEGVEKRVTEIKVIEKSSAKQKAEIAVLNERLKNAIEATPSNPSCDLSDDEFRLFNELADQTRR